MILTRCSLKNTRMNFRLGLLYAGVFLKYFTFMHLKMLYLNAVIMNTYFFMQKCFFFCYFHHFCQETFGFNSGQLSLNCLLVTDSWLPNYYIFQVPSENLELTQWVWFRQLVIGKNILGSDRLSKQVIPITHLNRRNVMFSGDNVARLLT